ncbi:MAG: phosphoribosylglycinamide formyltransferase [Chthoniobacterales bacterium]|nr:MAG: phosphoribosylglycinamide formyltransferase [Chthoniobacterales bacterium]
MVKIAILGSGKGSNCRAILQSIRDGKLEAEPVVVISDMLDAPILEIAREFGVPNAWLPPGQFRTRLEPKTEAQLVSLLGDTGAELIVLAGFMRVLKEPMLEAFQRRIVNIHPSLLPKYPGLQAWQQALAAGEKVTGVSVHYVDAQVDHGDIIAQREVPVLDGDTPESLHARIQETEHALYPEALARLVREL